MTCLLALAAAALGACGGEGGAAPIEAGVYLLDRADYARALAEAGRPEGAAPDDEAWAAVREAARKAAGSVQLRLDLSAGGTFVVFWQFAKERGRRRGSWSQDGDRLTLRVTHDAAGPVERGALVSATRVAEGLRFSDWPVPNSFLLRRQ